MNKPTFSIITVCKNAVSKIDATIESVINQKDTDFEYIIVDGASADGTLDAVNRYSDRISKIVSEPDGGMYEALNKAIRIATGEYVNLINADDRFISDDVLSRVAAEIGEGYDIVYGNLVYEDGEKHTDFIPPDTLSRKYLRYNCVTQQAIFYNRDIFDEVGLFDESYKIVADYQWLIRAYKSKKVIFKHIGVPVAYFGVGGLTTGAATREKYRKERARVRAEQFYKIEYLFDWLARKIAKLLSR